jgi:uncharacterized surface protein with fasciclin (FAS1) repeats
MHALHRTISLALILVGLAMPSGALRAEEEMNLKAAAAKTGVLTHMTAATKLAGLDSGKADGLGSLTLLAPTDTAFMTLDPEVRAKLLSPENVGLLTRVLLHHVLLGEYPTKRLLAAKVRNYTISAVDGTEIEVYRGERGIDVDEGRIVRGDIVASDGIIHLIDRVLIPADLMAEIVAAPMPDKIADAPSAKPGNPEVAGAATETGSVEQQ